MLDMFRVDEDNGPDYRRLIFRAGIILALASLLAFFAVVGVASATDYYVYGYAFPAGTTVYLDSGANGVTVSGGDGSYSIHTTSPSGPTGHSLTFSKSGYYEGYVGPFDFTYSVPSYYYTAGTVYLTLIPTPTPVPAPTAGFSANITSGYAPLTIGVTSSSSGSITSYDYNWGDGTAHGTSANMAHTYTAAGTYTVSLTVTGPGGSNTQTRTNYITVSEPAPVASFTGSPTSGTAPLTVTFDSSASTGPISTYAWSWGDGTANGTTANPSHEYASNGLYTVILTVTGDGGSSSQQRTNYINVSAAPPAAPVANFSADSTTGAAPFTVNFNSSNSTGSISSYAWSWGDGTANGTTANPSHEYTGAGLYTVILTVTGAGGSSSMQRTSYINATGAGATPTPTPTATPVPTPDPNLVVDDGTIGNLANTYLYTSNYLDGSVTVLSASTYAYVASFGTGTYPSDILVGKSGTYIYVVYTNSTYLDVYSSLDYGRVGHILLGNTTGQQYARMVASPDGKYIYVTLRADNKVVMYSVESNAVISSASLPVNSSPSGIVYGYNQLYVLEYGGHRVDVLHPVSLAVLFNVSYPQVGFNNSGTIDGPFDISYDRYYGRILVSNGNNSTSVINTTAFTRYINSTGSADQSRSSAANNTGYIYRVNGYNLSVFDPAGNHVGTIVMGTWMMQIIFNPLNKTMCVAAYDEGKIYVISGLAVQYTINVGTGPSRLCIGTQATPATALIQIKVQDETGLWLGNDLNVTVYYNGMMMYRQTTDSTGTTSFYLSPTYTYTFLVSGGKISQSTTVTINPTQSFYTIKIPYSQIIGFSSIADQFLNQTQHANIFYAANSSYNISTGTLFLNCSYADANLLTSSVTYLLYINNSTSGGSPALVTSVTMAGASNSYDFTVPDATGKDFTVRFNATQTSGAVKSYYRSISVPGPKVWAGLLPPTWYWWLAFIPVFLLFGAGVATKKGMIAMCGTAWAAIANLCQWWEITPMAGVRMPPELMWLIVGLCFLLSMLMLIAEAEKYK